MSMEFRGSGFTSGEFHTYLCEDSNVCWSFTFDKVHDTELKRTYMLEDNIKKFLLGIYGTTSVQTLFCCCTESELRQNFDTPIHGYGVDRLMLRLVTIFKNIPTLINAPSVIKLLQVIKNRLNVPAIGVMDVSFIKRMMERFAKTANDKCYAKMFSNVTKAKNKPKSVNIFASESKYPIEIIIANCGLTQQWTDAVEDNTEKLVSALYNAVHKDHADAFYPPKRVICNHQQIAVQYIGQLTIKQELQTHLNTESYATTTDDESETCASNASNEHDRPPLKRRAYEHCAGDDVVSVFQNEASFADDLTRNNQGHDISQVDPAMAMHCRDSFKQLSQDSDDDSDDDEVDGNCFACGNNVAVSIASEATSNDLTQCNSQCSSQSSDQCNQSKIDFDMYRIFEDDDMYATWNDSQ